jgi:hypothetical protein
MRKGKALISTSSPPRAMTQFLVWRRTSASRSLRPLRKKASGAAFCLLFFMGCIRLGSGVEYINTEQEARQPRLAAAEGDVELGGKPQSGIAYHGELAQADDSTYVAIRDGAAAREGPGSRWPSHFTLAEGQKVTALAKFVCGDDHRCPRRDKRPLTLDDEKVWIKIRTEDGKEGFVYMMDLLSPTRLEERKSLIAGQAKLRQYFERAKKASGPLASFAGVYDFRPCSDYRKRNTGLPLYLFGLYLQWSEQNKFYRTSIKTPDVFIEYAVTTDKVATFSKTGPEPFSSAGTVQVHKLTPVRMTPMAKGETEYVGFKSDNMFYRIDENRYKVMQRCGSLSSKQEEILEDLYVEAIERFPRFKNKD